MRWNLKSRIERVQLACLIMLGFAGIVIVVFDARDGLQGLYGEMWPFYIGLILALVVYTAWWMLVARKSQCKNRVPKGKTERAPPSLGVEHEDT